MVIHGHTSYYFAVKMKDDVLESNMDPFFVKLQNFGQTCVQDEDREVQGEDYTWSGLGSDYEEDQSGARVAKYKAPEFGSAEIAMLGGN